MIRKIGFGLLVGLFMTEILARKLASITFRFLAQYSPKSLRKRFRVGSLVSRIVRPLFEYKKIKAVFGANLAAGILTIGALGVPVNEELGSANPNVGDAEMVMSVDEPVVTTNETGFQIPVTYMIGVSTRFTYGHPGVDMRSPLGSEVHPIGKGIVSAIIHSNTGYGRRVIVEHEDGLMSLYAHLGLINVDEGDEVDYETKLGEIGLTGWTTGPHLHFEIYKDGAPVNPYLYLTI